MERLLGKRQSQSQTSSREILRTIQYRKMVGRPVIDHRSSVTIRNLQTNPRDGETTDGGRLTGAAVNQEDTGEAATSRQHVPGQNVYIQTSS